jgi:alpha-1,3-mannosyltransferase
MNYHSNHNFGSRRDRTEPDIRRILGVNVHAVGAREAISELDRRISVRSPTRVAFLNAHLANLAFKNARLREVINSFLVFNDGLGVDLASLILYKQAFPCNLNGTDFIPNFLHETRHDLSVALVGSQPEVVQKFIKEFERRWPRHRIVASHHGYFQSYQEETLITEKIKASNADILFVAMGNPKQEEWVQQYVPKICCIGFGVGGFFDFFSGFTPRAPLFIRRARLEWLYRLLIEPQRLWRRYTVGNIAFMSRVLRQYFVRRDPS